ncbi:MAG TPA: hypothetical protein VK395_03080 [Gemmataceae bacterium]|nr:hypothetical protein [Gemmataceae bacterium]
MTQTKHSPEPWAYDYNPYTGHDGSEIPAFQVLDAECDKVFETNEDTPAELQEANACLGAAAPELLDALTYFFTIMHDYESSIEKGYVQQAMKQAKVAIETATGRAA